MAGLRNNWVVNRRHALLVAVSAVIGGAGAHAAASESWPGFGVDTLTFSGDTVDARLVGIEFVSKPRAERIELTYAGGKVPVIIGYLSPDGTACASCTHPPHLPPVLTIHGGRDVVEPLARLLSHGLVPPLRLVREVRRTSGPGVSLRLRLAKVVAFRVVFPEPARLVLVLRRPQG